MPRRLRAFLAGAARFDWTALAAWFDARRKIRRALVANGYMEEPGLEQR